MSGFGGFGGFGQNNNPQQTTGFGGFGSSTGTGTGTGTGFGSTGTTGGFGSTNTTGGGLFGGGGSTVGFGGSGGFGTTTNNAFGAKPSGFGTTTTTAGSSLFGGGTATTGSTGFGGFGSTPAATSSPFGASSSTGGGLFGASKPAFGSTTPASTNPFGGAATSTPFGGTPSAFGAPASTALGGNTGDCQGTGSVPFQPTIEKEPNSNTNQQNSFQSISFQQPYSKFSPEELRLADYSQGRRYGNASNQAGAFGANTNFGGFGSSTTGGFGSSTTGTGGGLFGGGSSSTPFGGSQPAATGFGANTATSGGGLFGSKPATSGGLFGSQPTQPSGGLFGSGGTGTTGAFGSTTTGGFGATNTANTGSSLFGNNNNAPKPGFSFGNTPSSTGAGFGTSPATGGFGSGGLFGSAGQQQNNNNPFGGSTTQPTTNTAFGGGFGNNNNQQQPQTGGLFGSNNQLKPAGGLFGSAPAATGTSLFAGAQPAQNNNPFGGAANQNTGGLFGSKPATTGTSLFGNTNTNNNQTNPGGGLFGGFGQNLNQNQQQNNSGGLFGGLNTNNNNNQQKPSLFGGQTQQQGGGGLFGASGTQQQGGLFGGLNNSQQQQQQPQNNSLFGGNSIFGGSQQGQQTPQSLTTSISDNAAFGSSSLFSNLASTQANNPGPIATPLSSSTNKQKKSAAIPLYKLNSASTSRFTTPQKRGFGFSYSNYNSPGSASSTASTPGAFSNSSLGGTFGRTLSKSVSTSSLRRSFNTEDSILAPGAFSASPSGRHFGSTGSVKKLVINRSLRSDLFTSPNGQPQQGPSTPGTGILKKRVSFDNHTAGTGANGMSSPLKHVQNNGTPSAEDLGLLRPRATANGINPTSTASPPEMEQVRNNELAVVHEEEASALVPSTSQNKPISMEDQEPGQYWMKPSKEEINNMNRVQKQKVTGFTVGREGVGQIQFNVPVDLTSINIDDILGNIVELHVRSATVYSNPAKKPHMGKGLNVPSTIELQNSWPRKKELRSLAGDKTGAKFKKHIDRLQKVADTKFVSYDQDTGVWTFTVEHFTTYGFPEDDDAEGEEVSEFGQSTLSAPPDTPTPKTRTPRSQDFDQSFASTSQVTQTESDPEDTFEFRKKKAPPGAFDDQDMYEDDEEDMEEYDEQDQESFLDERSVGSQSDDGVEEPMDQDDVFQDDESVSIVDKEMAGSYPQAVNTAELDEDSQDELEDMDIMEETPGTLVRARMRAAKNSGTPMKRTFAAGNDWTSALKTTISPQKQDRALLKSLIDVHGNESRPDAQPTPMARRVVSDGCGFATSIDLMNSLFGQTRSPAKIAKVAAKGKGFEWPYAKRTKTNDNDTADMTDVDRAFHYSMKPSWGPDGILVYAAPPNAKSFGRSSRRTRERDGLLIVQKDGVVSESRDVRFAKFSNEAGADFLQKQKAMSSIDAVYDAPMARLPEKFSFSDFFDDRNVRDPAALHEKLVWQLASVLWDDIVIPDELQQFPKVMGRLRKDKLSEFWQKLVDEASSKHVAMAKSNEEKAIASLSGHRVPDACGHLLNGKDFHLATLVALIGGKDRIRKDIREQLNDWQKSRALSEFSQPIRAIYELLAGNVCVCDGTKGVPVEDKVESFIISKRFGLDWRQAFGLRLWYGILSNEPIENAIAAYAQDLAQDKETARPQAWYVEQGVPTLWNDEDLEEREDLLWGLLKIYTFDKADLESTLRPENSQLSPLDVRLSWQLSQALTSSEVIGYGNDYDKADQLTLDFASQLTNEGSWLDAVFVLLHFGYVEEDETMKASELEAKRKKVSEARAKAIQDHLAQHAGRIGSEDSQNFATLTQTYKIPSPWIWEARALYMRSVAKNPRGEVECLIKAGSFDEAHRTFTRDVAPKTIIEMDYDTLRQLLAGFHGKENTISEWHLGGEIYQDFLELLDCQKQGRAVDHAALERLLAALPAVTEDGSHTGFMERVAVETISGVVAKTAVALGKKGEKSDLHKVLRLPLTEDKYLKHTVELSLEYYKGVMATGR